MTHSKIVPMRGPLSRIIDSPFHDFVNNFFTHSLPITLVERQESYPKYNLTRDTKEAKDHFHVEMAVAGFSKDDISVSTEDDILYVRGNLEKHRDEGEFLYQGIATRNFEWTLKMPEYTYVEKTTLIDGILKITVKQNLPEEKKPKTYTIE